MTIHVNVQLKTNKPNGEWQFQWRQVQAKSLDEAILLAEKMPDVLRCLEASFIPGGVAV